MIERPGGGQVRVCGRRVSLFECELLLSVDGLGLVGVSGAGRVAARLTYGAQALVSRLATR
jgi:hypothetical protein